MKTHHTALALAPLLLLSLSAAGCGGETREGILMTGWHMGWADLSHRISYLNVALNDDGTGDMGFIGGDWSTGEEFSDSLLWRLGAAQITTNRGGFASGASAITIEPAADGSEYTGTATGSVDLATVGEFSEYVALISGFGMWTDIEQTHADYPEDYSPANGYTSLGFGVSLGEVTVDGDQLTFPVSLRFHHGPTDEDILDRPQMSEAAAYAVTEGEVRYTVVGFDGARETVSLSDQVDHPYEPAYSEQDPLVFDVAAGHARRAAAPGWSAFDFVANGGEGNNADYIRAAGAELLAETVDAGLTGAVEADFNNSSAFELAPFSVAFTGSLEVLSLKGTEVTPIGASGEAEIGDWTTGALE